MLYVSYIACKGTNKRVENQEILEFSRVEVPSRYMSQRYDYFKGKSRKRELTIIYDAKVTTARHIRHFMA